MFNSVDKIEEIKNFPQSSVGAPIPAVVSDEHHLFLLYYVENVPEDFDETQARVVEIDSSEESTAIITFNRYYTFKFGPPDDEAIAGHPLHKKRVQPYSIYTQVTSKCTFSAGILKSLGYIKSRTLHGYLN